MADVGFTTGVERFASIAEPNRLKDAVADPIGKRCFDLAVSIIGLALVGVIALTLLLLNPFFNRGKLFYKQPRMGRDCSPFTVYKFRSMLPENGIQRNVDDPLERERITPLGDFLRRTRIDELPQLLNILRGQMSLIGPRPDYYQHACHFIKNVDGYRERHMVRPGISGLAQTEIGYVEGTEATRVKVNADLYYIANRNWQLELWIIWRTVVVILKGQGS